MAVRTAAPVITAPQLLRFATAGSVDDGKSTLIGRLLYDSKALMADQVADAELDLARLTDGLRAEREQGITIDVAYRHFATPRRRFIIADTPGHAQYTRNMVTGASTADVAIVLLDAREGPTEQSRRHTFIASLLGLRHVVFAINKMDLVDWDEGAYERIVDELTDFTARLDLRDRVGVQRLRVVEQAADQRRLAVVDRAGGGEAQQPPLTAGHGRGGRRHQK